MPIIFYNGKILFVNGRVAMDPNCCCGSVGGCCCPLLNANPPTYPTPTLTISSTCAALDGKTATLTANALFGGCVIRWTAGTISLGSCPTVEVKISFIMECIGDINGCEDFVLSSGANISGCIQAGFSRIPVDAGCSCNPVHLVWSNLPVPCKNPAQAECDCCACSDTMTVTVTL
mgnify:CR=1 FL=1